MTESPIIFIWCHLRSISTAFERAFIQRNDFIAIHEPYSEPFYVGPERLTRRYPEHYGATRQHVRKTYGEATAEIIDLADQNREKSIFCKDMALYIMRRDAQQQIENPTMLDLEFLKRCKHTFLVRNPEKSMPSLYRCYKDIEYDTSFNAQEAGFVELRILYNFITKLNNGSPPPLIDADDLVEDPNTMMTKYCAQVGIPFKSEMMEWKAEKVETFEKWREYHMDAEHSTRIKTIVRDQNEALPNSVYEAIRENMPIYNELRRYRIRL
jgi:hypothetical protein